VLLVNQMLLLLQKAHVGRQGLSDTCYITGSDLTLSVETALLINHLGCDRGWLLVANSNLGFTHCHSLVLRRNQ